MLRMGKSQATQPAVGTVRCMSDEIICLLQRKMSRSCKMYPYQLHRSTEALGYWLALQPQQSSSILITTAAINFESAGSNARLVNDFKSQGKANRIHSRSKSFDSSISKHLANSCPKVEDRIFQIRPKSAPSFGSANPIVLDEASTDSGFNTKALRNANTNQALGTLYLL
ncbi:hypothetical protein OS493_025516 [Desmophyllum pertusum]|uniref:Uncharacterized protein n=1 Tax=Desmophyllum pertusum TaxID=174260 RepID=A0A9X0CF67_9CNID|nr:hypothetical protein OS493_025516 [Desmophyllum pertusum]